MILALITKVKEIVAHQKTVISALEIPQINIQYQMLKHMQQEGQQQAYID